LDFQPGIGAGIEGISDKRITAADQNCKQQSPTDAEADFFVQRIDVFR
jgi:hypothetical protein